MLLNNNYVNFKAKLDFLLSKYHFHLIIWLLVEGLVCLGFGIILYCCFHLIQVMLGLESIYPGCQVVEIGLNCPLAIRVKV